jgi:hypothetical protein
MDHKSPHKAFLFFCLIIFSWGVSAQSYPTVYFGRVWQGDSLVTGRDAYSTAQQNIKIVKLLVGTNFRFVGTIAGSNFTPTSGNDVGGIFYYEDINGNTFSKRGVVTRVDKTGSTPMSFYFFVDATHAYLFVRPLYESTYTLNNNVTTSSDFRSTDLDAYKSVQVALTTASTTVCQNGSASPLNASSTLTDIASYRWYYNTTNSASVSGATLAGTTTTTSQTASFTPSTASAGVRYYFVQVLNSSGSQIGLSNTIAVTVNAPPSISSYSGTYTNTQSVCQYGIPTPLSVNATVGSGNGPYYQWYSNTTTSTTGGVLISGATNSTFSPPTTAVGTNYYYCIVSNSNGCTVTSDISGQISISSASVTGGTLSGSTEVCSGTNSATLTLSGESGTLTITNWQSSPLADFSASVTEIASTSSSITVNNLTSTTYYRAVLSGSCTITQSSPASVIVNQNTAITVQPSTETQTVCQNSIPTALSVTATGGNLAYAWYSNTTSSNTSGTLIGGAVSSTYLPPTSVTGTKYYYVVVTGSCGSAVTSTVSGAISVTALTGSLTLSPTSITCGSSSTLSITLTGTSPWDITYSDGSTSYSIFGITTATQTTVSPAATTTYTLLSIVDGNFCEGLPNTTATLTVNPISAPTIGTVTQAGCSSPTGSVALGGLPASGTWTVTATGGATITGTGTTATFSNLAAGVYTFTVTSGNCTSAGSSSVTINAASVVSAGTLSGTQSICISGTTTYTSTASGGSWSSSNTGVATVNAITGVVTGVAAGTTTITYTVAGTGGCASETATRSVTVTAPPDAGTLSGTQSICISGTTTYTSTASGGSWSSSNTGVATVNAITGVVTGVAAGTTTITYTVAGTGGCASETATRSVTVTTPPDAGTIIQSTSICVGSSSTLTSTTSGGTWSSSTIAVATIGMTSGLITGVATGTTTITYTVAGTGGCADDHVTRTITVYSTTTLSPSNITVCREATCLINVTTTAPGALGWNTTDPLTVNSGYITAGTTTGTNFQVSYTDGCGQTISATVTVVSTSTAPAISDNNPSYKFNGNPQGPTSTTYTINYVGYDGFVYFSQTQPSSVGFYKANTQVVNVAGCPNRFYIFSCATCNN